MRQRVEGEAGGEKKKKEKTPKKNRNPKIKLSLLRTTQELVRNLTTDDSMTNWQRMLGRGKYFRSRYTD